MLAHGPPSEVRDLASGRSFIAEPAPGQTARGLQATTSDEPQVLDAVPEGGVASSACRVRLKDLSRRARRRDFRSRGSRSRRDRLDSRMDSWCCCVRRIPMRNSGSVVLDTNSTYNGQGRRSSARTGANSAAYRRGSSRLRGARRSDFQPLRSQWRRQDHYFPHAVQAAAGDEWYVARGRYGFANRAPRPVSALATSRRSFPRATDGGENLGSLPVLTRYGRSQASSSTGLCNNLN